MKSIKPLIAMTALLSFTVCNAQIKNAKTEIVKIYGNCDMCESAIEKAGNVKKAVTVDWNNDTKMATLTYDTRKTNQDEILKRIALAGYDNEKFLAPDDAYAKLTGCCQYERTLKPAAKAKAAAIDMKNEGGDHDHNEMVQTTSPVSQNMSPLKAVFDSYFAIKDALVASDAALASAKAKALLSALDAVKMEKLASAEHTVWMNVMKDLAFDAGHIEGTKEVGHQRDHFTSLSDNMYQLFKASKQDTPVYYQHCPMFNKGKGANWLSKENAIKNPYYGSTMMTCGSTVETIK